MKLNFKNTVLVGLAFFAIEGFWQFYDAVMPLVLDMTFGVSNTIRGIIMSIDNFLALILIPLFGWLSDKYTSKKFGRRTPYIIIGISIGAIGYFAISILDNIQMNRLLSVIPEITELTDAFTRQQTIWAFTQSNPTIFYLFVALTALVVFFMGVCRSPAVALMPDITPKPLRTKGNAIINFMGVIGGLLGMALFIILFKEYNSRILMSGLMSLLMLASLVIFILKINENKLVKEKEETIKRFNVDESETAITANVIWNDKKAISLILALFALFLCNFGYNAVSSHLTVYANDILGFSGGTSGIIMMIAILIFAVASYPIALISDRIGRRKAIMVGLVLLTISFIAVSFVTEENKWLMYVLFSLVGISLALIKGNQYPLVMEMSKNSNIGQYTAYYYIFSMSAQMLTPGIVGWFMDNTEYGRRVLFPYGTIFVLLSFITMLFVKFGDAVKIRE